MKQLRSLGARCVASFIVLSLASALSGGAATSLDTHGIDAASGFRGIMLPGDVYKVNLARSDLHVTVDGVPLKTALALGGYAVYKVEGNGTLVIGDIPLLQAEVAPVEKALIASGFEITALHNHLLRDQPHIMYMHYMKIGDAVAIARDLRRALQLTAIPPAKPPSATKAAPFEYANQIDQALKLKGSSHDGVYSIAVARPESVSLNGMMLPPAMGVATGINFQTVDPGRIAAAGDLVLTESEVADVEPVLLAHGIEVVALHHHLIGSTPMLYFLHIWGVGSPATILSGVRAAIDIARRKG